MRRVKAPLSITSLSSMSSASFIDNLPANKQALHDIRFRFRVDSILTVIQTNHPFMPKKRERGLLKMLSLPSSISYCCLTEWQFDYLALVDYLLFDS
jgi:hypothetical protein